MYDRLSSKFIPYWGMNAGFIKYSTHGKGIDHLPATAVILTKAEIQFDPSVLRMLLYILRHWTPACAGVT